MLRLIPRSWLALIFVVGGLGFGCSKSGTFVVLDFKAGASAPTGVKSIDVGLTLGGKTAMTTYTAPGGAEITLPTSATLEIGAGSGGLTVSALARDKGGAGLAMATAAGTVTTGSTTHVAVQFGGPAPDGGAGGTDGGSGGAGGEPSDGPPTEGGADGGPTPPQLATDKATYDFGTQVTTATGAAVASTVITVTNTGGQKTGTIIVGVIDSATFPTSADTCSGMTLDPGATCTVTIKFMPGTSGAKSSKLQVGATPGGTAAVTLSGMAVDPGALSLAPDHGTFDPLPQGQVSAEATFTVTNTGGAATTALTAMLSGTSAGEFKISTDNCTGKTLAGNETCTVGVKFAPTTTGSPGVESAVLAVAATTGGTAAANLSGTALGPAALSIVATDQDFLMVVQGQASAEFIFVVTNKGGVASGALVTGIAPSGEFAISSNTCDGMTLAPNGTCKIGVTMTPSAPGQRSASLTVRGSPGGSAVATLRGTGLAPGMIVLSPQPKDFGIADVGTPAAVPFTVTNTGGAPTTALTLKLTGATELTIVADTCTNMTLAPNTACTFRVVFTPTTFGARAGSLSASATTGGTSTQGLQATGRDYVGLTVTKSGAGGGTVAGAGLTCANATCTGSYGRTDPAAFQVVSLSATPDALSTFTGWSGAGCTGTGACQVSMSMAQAVTATFAVKQVLITATVVSVSAQTGTIVTDDGAFTCSTGTCGPNKHNAQTSITINAKAGAASSFIAWSSGPCKGVNPVCTIPLTGDIAVTATFGPPSYMFVTSTTVVAGHLNGVAGADAECVARATAAGLPGTYKAWLSDVGANANARVGTGGWVRTDGRPFTRTLADLKAGVVYYPPRVDENGNDLGPKRITVLTGGTGAGASFGAQCYSSTTPSYTQVTGSAYIGIASAGSFYWAYNQLDSQGCSDQQHLYCFRTDLAAPVTMPTTPGRHIFVSTNAFTPNSGIAGADKQCQDDATAYALPNASTFVAFLATSTTPALKRVNLTGLPWKRTDEVLVVATPADLGTGNLLAPVDLDAKGVNYSNPQMWTGGVDPVTAGTATCNDWKTATAGLSGQFGYPNATIIPDWFNSGTLTCDNMYGWIMCIGRGRRRPTAHVLRGRGVAPSSAKESPTTAAQPMTLNHRKPTLVPSHTANTTTSEISAATNTGVARTRRTKKATRKTPRIVP